jgi:hypothetical protein
MSSARWTRLRLDAAAVAPSQRQGGNRDRGDLGPRTNGRRVDRGAGRARLHRSGATPSAPNAPAARSPPRQAPRSMPTSQTSRLSRRPRPSPPASRQRTTASTCSS